MAMKFISRKLDLLNKENKITLAVVFPGKPIQNGCV